MYEHIIFAEDYNRIINYKKGILKNLYTAQTNSERSKYSTLLSAVNELLRELKIADTSENASDVAWMLYTKYLHALEETNIKIRKNIYKKKVTDSKTIEAYRLYLYQKTWWFSKVAEELLYVYNY